MKVFLTYASEQKSIAEATAFSLRSRGYDVFLDKDDLPPGRSYDEQIEMGIKASDYLVFLISPQSVQQGRYTRTELEYARRKWRHPDGRILPVMVQPTAMADVPEFLRAVTILEPKGNIAAEIGAHVAATETLDARSLMLWFVGAAAVSGLLGMVSADLPGALLLSHLLSASSSIYVGILFGLAICAPLFFRLSVPILKLTVVMVVVQVAWQVAVNSGVATYQLVSINQGHSAAADQSAEGDTSDPSSVTKGEAPKEIKDPPVALMKFNAHLVVSGLIGGLIWSFGSWLGASTATARLRHLEAALLTTTVGTFAGGVATSVELTFLSAMPLLVIWQMSVAATLARGIARSK